MKECVSRPDTRFVPVLDWSAPKSVWTNCAAIGITLTLYNSNIAGIDKFLTVPH